MRTRTPSSAIFTGPAASTTGLRPTAGRYSPAILSLRPGFWRVLHPSGAVLGYVEEAGPADSPRFAARRLIANTTRLVDIGEFWALDDAVSCFRS